MVVESLKQDRRIAYIDIARGIGILLVVLGHSDLALVSPYLHQLVYSFHIPLFFFLSGIFFDADTTPGLFFKKRFRAILQPYLFTIFLIFVASISFTNMGIGTALGRLAKSMYASTDYIWWIPLWFLPALFVASLFSYSVYRGFLGKISNHYIRWAILLAFLVIGVIFIDSFYPFSVPLFGKSYELYGLPYNIDIVLISGFFYMLGAEFQKIPLISLLEKRWFLLLSGGSLFALTAVFSDRMDLAVRVYESFSINTIEALLGIVFTLSLSKQIALRSNRFVSILSYLGQASLFILIFHAPIQEYWGAKILDLTNLPAVAILLAFFISTAISLGIYNIFVERNPSGSFWFGRKPSIPGEQEGSSERSIETSEAKIQKHGEP